MEWLQDIGGASLTIGGAIGGGIAGAIALILGLIKLDQLWRPVRVEPSYRVIFDESVPDEIRAKITNRTGEPLYVVRCIARSTYPITTIIGRHICHPLTPPRLYGTLRYGGQNFPFLEKKNLKLEGYEQIELCYPRSTHPLSAFLAPMFLVEVELSSRRKFRSARLLAPPRWLFKVPKQPPVK